MGARSTSELAATKFAAPQPPVPLVDRPQLESSLCAALDDEGCRLILVSAPAGSGKSTVVASAVAQRADATAWLQLEVADGDPERFRRYLVSAIGSVRPGIARSLRPFLAVAPRSPDRFVERLVNALAAEDRPLALVLDDLHLVGDPEVHELLERLVDLAPPCFTLVAVTRADPPLRLGRLRLRRRLVEVRADALRFEAHQAVGLLGAGAARLSSAQLERLYERTEGWAAGLVLAGLSLDATDDVERFVGDFHGDDRLVVDYLSEEFLAALPPDDRDRLLRTSILERLHGPLVDAVCGSSDGATWLRRAAGANQLIIGLDRTGSSYRYHHLLGQLLRLEAAAHLGAELPELHRRAALWFQQHGDSHEAVEHLLAAGAHADAAELIWQEATRLLNGGQLRTVAGQIERLGPLADQHAGCVLVRAWISLVTGRSTSARRLVEQARSLGPPDDLVAPMLDALGVMIALAEGDAGAALAVAEAALPPRESTQAMTLAIARVMAGRIDEARPLLDDAAALATAEGHTFVEIVTAAYDAFAELHAGRPERAAARARWALERADARRYDQMAQLALAHSVAARTAPEPEAAAVAARRGVELARRSSAPIVLAYALAAAADVGGTGDEAAAFLLEAQAVVGRSADPGIAGPYVARVAARHGLTAQPADAPALVEQLTAREAAVLRYLASPMSQREIAGELFVSLNTVKTHCRAIFRKLGVGDRRAAVAAAVRLGLL